MSHPEISPEGITAQFVAQYLDQFPVTLDELLRLDDFRKTLTTQVSSSWSASEFDTFVGEGSQRFIVTGHKRVKLTRPKRDAKKEVEADEAEDGEVEDGEVEDGEVEDGEVEDDEVEDDEVENNEFRADEVQAAEEHEEVVHKDTVSETPQSMPDTTGTDMPALFDPLPEILNGANEDLFDDGVR